MAKILPTICIQGGSKGVPNKNIREFGGKPLVGHAVPNAKERSREATIVIATDSNKIRIVVEEYDTLPFRWLAEFADDEAAKVPGVKHAVREMESEWADPYNYDVDIDVATPLSRASDIESCFETVDTDPPATNVYSVCEADKNPYFNMVQPRMTATLTSPNSASGPLFVARTRRQCTSLSGAS